MLDSLVPVSDQLPETTRITFIQRAVQQNHDLRQIHVMDSVWRFKTDSTDDLTFDTNYNHLRDAAHQCDLHQVQKVPQRKAFFSQQEEISGDDEYANAEEQFSTDPEPEEHSPYSIYHNSLYPILWVTTRYSYSKRCDTFCQDCTFLEACIPRKTRDAYD